MVSNECRTATMKAKEKRFYENLSANKNSHSARARRRKMERELKKLGNDKRTSD